jgi:hypothetical protein
MADPAELALSHVTMKGETHGTAAITRLTRPLNGQYPRPWMTEQFEPAKQKFRKYLDVSK